MTLVSDNIRYLRKLNGLTQEQFSRKINIKRSLLGAYEEGRANPNQQNMQAIAKAFNTTIELLTRQDLRKIRETPSLSIPLGQKAPDTYTGHRHPADNGPTLRSDGRLSDDEEPFQHPDFPDIFAAPTPTVPESQPLSSVLNKYYKAQEQPGLARSSPAPPVITPPVRPEPARTTASETDALFGQHPERWNAGVSISRPEVLTFNNVYEELGPTSRPAPGPQPTGPAIPIVLNGQFIEYRQRFQQPDFLLRLPNMFVPTLAEGQYRAFEAGADFAFPGALLIGKFVRNWFDIADGSTYVLLLNTSFAGQTLCCRRVYNQVKSKGTLLLAGDRPDVASGEIPLKEVLEVWEVSAFLSQQMPPPPPNTDRLHQLLDELKNEVSRL